MNFGLRPITRINYKIERNEKIAGMDSMNTVFEGNGGSYEVYTGMGIGIKNFSIGFNIGYLFGSKDYKTTRNFLPDSADVFYYPSEYSTNSSFGGLFVNGGIQYSAKLSKTNTLMFGAHGNLKRELHATKDEKIQTIRQNEFGVDSIDVISRGSSSGEVVYPTSYGFGMIYRAGEKWLLGADFNQTKWTDYRFFGEQDLVQDSWSMHVGGQLQPSNKSTKSYWGFVTYRAGFFFWAGLCKG